MQGASIAPLPGSDGQNLSGAAASSDGLPAAGTGDAEASPTATPTPGTASPSPFASASASRTAPAAAPDDGHVATSQSRKPLEISPGPVVFAAAGLLLTGISGVGLYRRRTASDSLARRLADEATSGS